MKLKYGLLAVIAATAIVTSCAEDDAPFSEVNTPTENNTTYLRRYESQLFMNWGQGSGKNGYFAVNGNTGLSSDCAYHNNVMI